ncbi:MAG: alpha/beta fold hydrolase [Pseudomonadota bacterium]
MPVIASNYQPPRHLRLGHVQTVLPTLARRVPAPTYERTSIDTPDGDFLDLDWARVGASRLVLICHGLEGDSQRAYVRGMGRALNAVGWDVLAYNCRGCGGRPNRTPAFYHSGATGDLDLAVGAALARGYQRLALVGFSLGGNLVMKYLGELASRQRPQVKAGVGFSVPCDLADSGRRMEMLQNRVYVRRFLRMLRAKIRQKMPLVAGAPDDRGYGRIKNFRHFDDRYTAPLHGFADAMDYYRQASCRPFLPRIAVPALMVNALDDPLLGPGCFPWTEARQNPCFFLEAPAHGGHVGFMAGGGRFWSEARAVEFLNSVVD